MLIKAIHNVYCLCLNIINVRTLCLYTQNIRTYVDGDDDYFEPVHL